MKAQFITLPAVMLEQIAYFVPLEMGQIHRKTISASQTVFHKLHAELYHSDPKIKNIMSFFKPSVVPSPHYSLKRIVVLKTSAAIIAFGKLAKAVPIEIDLTSCALLNLLKVSEGIFNSKFPKSNRDILDEIGESGQLDLVQQLGPLNRWTNSEILEVAISYAKPSIARAILATHPFSVYEKGYFCLLAITKRLPDLALELLGNGIQITYRNCALVEASKKGYLELVQKLIQKEIVLDNTEPIPADFQMQHVSIERFQRIHRIPRRSFTEVLRRAYRAALENNHLEIRKILLQEIDKQTNCALF